METNNYTYYFGKSVKCNWCLNSNIPVKDVGCECGSCLDFSYICYECEINQEKENLGKGFRLEF